MPRRESPQVELPKVCHQLDSDSESGVFSLS